MSHSNNFRDPSSGRSTSLRPSHNNRSNTNDLPNNQSNRRPDELSPPPYSALYGQQTNPYNQTLSSYRNPVPVKRSDANATQENRSKNLLKFINKYEISPIFANRLRAIEGCEIVFVCDDSGSMNLELYDVPASQEGPPTRWDELKRTVSIVVDVATTLDPDGVDIYFLNRSALKNVRSSEELHETFSIPPEGPTPLVPVLREVLHDKRQQIQDRKLILIVATDGQPTDDYGEPDIDELQHFLQRERRPIERIPVTIMACTDDKECMSYLNDWDDRIPNLDVVDDYQSEKKEILEVQFPGFPFSFGDYVMKILLGGVDPWFGRLDNEPIGVDHPRHRSARGQSSDRNSARRSNQRW